MRMPVRTPGPTMRGGCPKRWRESSSMLRERSGTTLLTTTAEIASGSSPAERSRETATRGRTGRITAAVKRVHLVCDSTADLGPAFYPAHDVEMIPLSIVFGEEQ